jgi:hypothetical protein
VYRRISYAVSYCHGNIFAAYSRIVVVGLQLYKRHITYSSSIPHDSAKRPTLLAIFYSVMDA